MQHESSPAGTRYCTRPECALGAPHHRHCRWCAGAVDDTQGPFGGRHREPVCAQFRDAMLAAPILLGVKQYTDGSGWYIDETHPGMTVQSGQTASRPQ